MRWLIAVTAMLVFLLPSAAEAACASTNECVSKLNGYSVLNGAGLDASKLNGYAILNGTGLNTSKINGYVVLNSGGVFASKINAYAVLCSTPGAGGCPAGPISASSGSMMLGGVGH